MGNDLEPSSALRRWLWFVGLWAAGVGTTGAVSLAIRFWLT
jgi:hypothetical protein